ncbi:IS200/IS605 family element transposase accessory protein TnpB [Desertifilum sp. FACHB-1129]|uniref:Transposase n=2 Tax=Desertifilum tharense IPPAS B-1220 TaxID=1781255 RepID=A0A1E5QK55_9CYAN|nr:MULTISPECIES: RNA-guided endonuclease TnpB family protein [Desertifilum]MDA0211342.1 transposase [Cyanobacteria bacterium FC1]MBD2313977.1 IS200/IS605 family element transposase accessory protein TnpB [Desertifilum sp. FACHB-1129]MBD2320303.1 IS200/IS605 family element transposase accessory protein TnpB [Desertifilum sp. FACHB-866]MBD2330431.1 IS200/IS605 family element transposase accessory protein TnpB [Desertifilum sp. FACHB-868]OEJ74733.1 transposase [Desertifilum tharense IPPAS B-1220]
MEQVLTLSCKLQPTPEQALKIQALLKAFADACNWVNQSVKPSVTSKIAIQSQVYQDIRARFGLSANQAVRVCARVGTNRKTAKLKQKPVKAFRPTSADYDARIFAFREQDLTVSLTLLEGREHIKLDIGNYQRGRLKGRKPTSAQLCKHRDGSYHIHIQLTDEAPEPIKADRVIGVDFGRREIAKTSTGMGWDGKQLNQVRERFSRVRASLQKKASRKRDATRTKGTRSSRRRCRQVLQRLSGRERRFQQWLNHTISAAIIREAKHLNAIVAIEDLTGIRDRTNQQPRNKTERRRSNSWAFYQLRQFLSYKGIKEGVEIVVVPPAYTSQTCNRCNRIGRRSEKVFRCGHCGWHGDADFNGALNIAALGLSVTQPRGSGLFCCLEQAVSGLPKAPLL